jgi:hypothetical protein
MHFGPFGASGTEVLFLEGGAATARARRVVKARMVNFMVLAVVKGLL